MNSKEIPLYSLGLTSFIAFISGHFKKFNKAIKLYNEEIIYREKSKKTETY